MRRRLVVAAIALGSLFLAACGGDGSGDESASGTGTEAMLETRTTSSGEIDLEIQPRQLDDQGAVFDVTLDTHSAELSMDLSTATLDVGGVRWPVAGWDGDGPGGHHREGTLRFDAGGSPAGTARLQLAGFPEPLVITWELGRQP